MKAEFTSRCPCGEPIEEGDEIRPLKMGPFDAVTWCCEGCDFTGRRKKAVVDMPPRGKRGTIMQTIEARRRRARRKG